MIQPQARILSRGKEKLVHKSHSLPKKEDQHNLYLVMGVLFWKVFASGKGDNITFVPKSIFDTTLLQIYEGYFLLHSTYRLGHSHLYLFIFFSQAPTFCAIVHPHFRTNFPINCQ